jgi:hypothetical protein
MKNLLMNRTWLLGAWTFLAAAILWADYCTGPNIAVSFLFLVPVALAARFNGRFCGLFFALILPLIRFSFYFIWKDPLSFGDALLNAVIRAVVLVGAAILIDRVTRQAREIHVLRGFLPICSFCKKIRDPNQQWQPLETYITEHSEAKFSHTFCPDCGRKNYGEWIGEHDEIVQPTESTSGPS